MRMIHHQFVERETGKIKREELIGDKAIHFLYSSAREKAPFLFRAVTSARFSSELLAFLKFDMGVLLPSRQSLEAFGINFVECLHPEEFTTMRRVFERQIRYWECRPMLEDPATVVSPADSRVIVGSLNDTSTLFLKEKFFDFAELLGTDKYQWLDAFRNGDFAVFRLTPEKYHYNHTPVSGEVVDLYEVSGSYHSCNPSATINVVTPFSKNKRVVTIVNSDVPGGTGVGLVAMVEVVALMIGDVVQAYSSTQYNDPKTISPGMFLKKGAPKSLYRPGSSTDLIIFQPGRVEFSDDLVRNRSLSNVQSRFSEGFGKPLVETDVRVRSSIGKAI
ncbi:MAG: phosphatidylserine decarboxylase [Syntrophaceae bacterium]|nr:phosphatidylserine decarboxylase [Syntrophaceae bacterium]